MKTRLPVVLALAATLALTACAPAQTADAPQNVQTAETAPAQETAPEPQTAGPAGAFFTVATWNATGPAFNAGDAYYMLDPTYRLGYCLLTEIDYATAEQRVVCRVPGCGHDTDACPAYFPGRGDELCVFPVGETLYVYHRVATMHYEGSWDDYYAEVVAPKLQERPQGWETLTDEELLAYCRGRYAEQSAPAGLYVIEGGGTSRRALTCTQDLANTTMRWCDGAALYGYSSGAFTMGARTGYRVSLADGSVTEFPLQENEWPCGVMGQNLLVNQFFTDAPLPDPDQNREAYDAALQNGYYAFYLLDPATGVRTPLLVDRAIVSDTEFRGQAGGWLYFATMQRDDAGALTRIGLRAYDTATGQWQDIAGANGSILDAEARALPGTAAQEGRWLWLESAAETPEAPNTAWVLDRQSGERYAVTQTIETTAPVDRTMFAAAVTDDGRFLLPLREKAPYTADYDYGLIAIDAFLQGSTDYTPVQMLA